MRGEEGSPSSRDDTATFQPTSDLFPSPSTPLYIRLALQPFFLQFQSILAPWILYELLTDFSGSCLKHFCKLGLQVPLVVTSLSPSISSHPNLRMATRSTNGRFRSSQLAAAVNFVIGVEFIAGVFVLHNLILDADSRMIVASYAMGASCALFSILGLVGNAYRKPLLVLALLFSLFVEATLTALFTLLVLDGRIVDIHDLCPVDLSRSTCSQTMIIFTFTSGAMIEAVLIILFHTTWSRLKLLSSSNFPNQTYSSHPRSRAPSSQDVWEGGHNDFGGGYPSPLSQMEGVDYSRQQLQQPFLEPPSPTSSPSDLPIRVT